MKGLQDCLELSRAGSLLAGNSNYAVTIDEEKIKLYYNSIFLIENEINGTKECRGAWVQELNIVENSAKEVASLFPDKNSYSIVTKF